MTDFATILDRLQGEDMPIPIEKGTSRRFDFAEVQATGEGVFWLKWNGGQSHRLVRIGHAITETEIPIADFVDRVRYAL